MSRVRLFVVYFLVVLACGLVGFALEMKMGHRPSIQFILLVVFLSMVGFGSQVYLDQERDR